MAGLAPAGRCDRRDRENNAKVAGAGVACVCEKGECVLSPPPGVCSKTRRSAEM